MLCTAWTCAIGIKFSTWADELAKLETMHGPSNAKKQSHETWSKDSNEIESIGSDSNRDWGLHTGIHEARNNQERIIASWQFSAHVHSPIRCHRERYYKCKVLWYKMGKTVSFCKKAFWCLFLILFMSLMLGFIFQPKLKQDLEASAANPSTNLFLPVWRVRVSFHLAKCCVATDVVKQTPRNPKPRCNPWCMLASHLTILIEYLYVYLYFLCQPSCMGARSLSSIWKVDTSPDILCSRYLAQNWLIYH